MAERTFTFHEDHPTLGRRVRLDHPHLGEGGFGGVGARYIAGSVVSEDEAKALGYIEREPDTPEQPRVSAEAFRAVLDEIRRDPELRATLVAELSRTDEETETEPGSGAARTAKRPSPRGE